MTNIITLKTQKEQLEKAILASSLIGCAMQLNVAAQFLLNKGDVDHASIITTMAEKITTIGEAMRK